jgi:NAD(P)-dependent dehydrogenase (short-subunit alcohol dehydrogenase family)
VDKQALTGRVVVIAGVGPGLGGHTALAAARSGAAVVMGARSREVREALVEEIGAFGGRALSRECDVTRPQDCRSLVEAAEAEFGAVDCLVANAFTKGTYGVGIAEADLADWRRVFEINFFGALHLIQAGAPALRRRGGGSIITVNSQAIRRAPAGRGDYTSSKAALLAATQILARELGPDGIRVNSVVPGSMYGPSVLSHYAEVAATGGPSQHEQLRSLRDRLALPYIPTDEDVAHVVVFLASDAARSITGQALDANAGETIR